MTCLDSLGRILRGWSGSMILTLKFQAVMQQFGIGPKRFVDHPFHRHIQRGYLFGSPADAWQTLNALCKAQAMRECLLDGRFLNFGLALLAKCGVRLYSLGSTGLT
ncbi:unnamed protein product [Effrenium voratum]|nr:unnamed protein product [Effrenium voratum]